MRRERSHVGCKNVSLQSYRRTEARAELVSEKIRSRAIKSRALRNSRCLRFCSIFSVFFANLALFSTRSRYKPQLQAPIQCCVETPLLEAIAWYWAGGTHRHLDRVFPGICINLYEEVLLKACFLWNALLSNSLETRRAEVFSLNFSHRPEWKFLWNRLHPEQTASRDQLGKLNQGLVSKYPRLSNPSKFSQQTLLLNLAPYRATNYLVYQPVRACSPHSLLLSYSRKSRTQTERWLRSGWVAKYQGWIAESWWPKSRC